MTEVYKKVGLSCRMNIISKRKRVCLEHVLRRDNQTGIMATLLVIIRTGKLEIFAEDWENWKL